MAGLLEGVVCGNIGVGAIGSYWTRLQRREGAQVLVYDANHGRAQQVAEDYGAEAVSLDELIGSSDWISTAVLPLKEVFSVMKQIGERKQLLKPGSLLLDHSGVKTGTASFLDELLRNSGVRETDTFASAMLKAIDGREAVEAIALHLAFRPDVELEGQNVYISPVKPADGGVWLPRVKGLLSYYGANIHQMTPEQQDLVTMRHQMLVWLSLFSAFEAIRKSGSDMSFPEMETFTTNLSKPFFDLMKRMTSGNWRVYWDTMSHHPHSRKAAGLLEQSMHELKGKLMSGEEAGGLFAAQYEHLKALAESGSPEQKTGKPVRVEIYYERGHFTKLKEAFRLDELPASPFYGNIVVSMIDSGRVNELHRAGIPVAAFTTLAHRDKTVQPEIAFHVRNIPHPEHPEKKGIRFSPIIPKDPGKAHGTIDSSYARVQLMPLHPDPVVNFFQNVAKDTVLSGLQPFVVYKPL